MQADIYLQHYRALPQCIRTALLDMDVDGTPTDMYLLSDYYEDTTSGFRDQLVEKSMDYNTSDILYSDIQTQVDKFLRLTHMCKRRRTRQDQIYEMYNRDLYPPDDQARTHDLITKAVQHWRHYKPSKYMNEAPTTQRTIEDTIGKKWRLKFLTHLLPVIEHLPHLHKHTGPDRWDKWHMLFGTTSANTVKNHCLAYIQITKYYTDPIFPWSDKSITNLLLYYMNHQAPVTRLKKAWKTIRWICKTFGLQDPADQTDLKNSYDHAVDKLTTTLYQVNRKAVVPTIQSIRALEKATANPNHTKATKYAAAVFRYQLGCSGRFNDIQHVAPSTLIDEKNTVEGKPWQTKTKKRHDHNNHKPLICPKHSFTGIPWWLPLTEGAPLLAAHESKPDYLLPQPDKAFATLIPRPCQYQTALKWLRHILSTNGSDDETTSAITLHSLRLWAAETAFLANIDRDKRRYIGQWSHESTADVYTRDHRTMITSIWTEMTSKLEQSDYSLLPPPKATAPKDPQDPEYFHSAEQDTETAAPTTPVPATTLPTEPLQPQPTNDLPTPMDFPSSKGGPLTIMINNNTTGRDRKKRIHYYTLGRRPIGCVTKYNPEKQALLATTDDYLEFCTEAEVCKFCNRHAQLPPEWIQASAYIIDDFLAADDTAEAKTAQQEDSTDNESCSTNDTASDAEPSIL